MKTLRYIILFMLFILFSCNESKTGNIAVYDREDFYRKIKIVDTACINGEKRAEKDFNNGKAKITKENLPSFKKFLPNEIISEELKKFNISLDMTQKESHFDSIGNRKLFINDCYQDMMRRKIYQKIEYKLIDSILEVSTKSYILEHPDLIINQKDLDGSYENSVGKEFDKCLKRIKLGFNFDFIYPDKYLSDVEKTSFINVDFTILKNGKLKNIKISTNFNNPLNKRFESYFQDNVITLIENIKWTPPYCEGIPVNANINLKLKHH